MSCIKNFRRPIALTGVVLIAFFLFSCSSTASDPVSEDALVLGTVVRISVYDDTLPRSEIDTLLDDAFARISEIERRMSTSEDDYESTELMEVNRAAGDHAVSVSPDTFHVVEEALRFSTLTDGAFDVSIGPLVKLWGIGSEGAHLPSTDEIAELLPLVDYRRVVVSAENDIYLPADGMALDVGGIAKGYAADEAAAILRDGGVESALLDFGGNILVIGTKPDGSDWRIGVQRPDAERSAYIGIVSAEDATVVTSGPYERFFIQDGIRYHHILDSTTGYPAEAGLQQVTIVADRSITADALSTACYVLGVAAAMELVDAFPGVEAIVVDSEKRVHLSAGAADIFSLTDDAYSLAE